MRVSFDLDDTLFVSPQKIKTENELHFPFNRIYKEHLRYGTISLINRLREQGIEVWIYTTSYRTPEYIRKLFKHYGVRIDRIINGKIHETEVQGRHSEAMPSKYPSKYHIDLHVDDDTSVEQNGQVYGFKVLLIGDQDDEWGDKVLKKIECIKKLQNNKSRL